MNTLPDTVLTPLSALKPYPNNPRKITEEAVTAVAESIRKYGYVQPIVVDEENVIIVGHTRLQALQKLGYTEAPVYVSTISKEKAAEFRLADNRLSEMGEWDHKSLVIELREWESSLLEHYFPDVDLEIGLLNDVDVTDGDVERATLKATRINDAAPIVKVTIVCPSCEFSFPVRADSLPGLVEGDLDRIQKANDAREAAEL